MPEFSAEQIEAILPFIAIGFFAQLVDGALGMAFGVIANTSLIAMAVPPAKGLDEVCAWLHKAALTPFSHRSLN